MIPFDFEYYKPVDVAEAVTLYSKLSTEGKAPIYYGGGTEFISMARMLNVRAGAVIDIKGILECNLCEKRGDELIFGSAVTLTHIAETNHFPLLSLAVKRIADHTIQDKITLGGNLAGTIIYKEAALPLMLADCDLVIAKASGRLRIPINDIFNRDYKFARDELIVQAIIKDTYLSLPHLHAKRTKNEKIDYPLLALVAMKVQDKISIALSGLYSYPYRSKALEEHLNNGAVSKEDRISNGINSLPNGLLNDLSGSSDYRKFILDLMLHEVLDKFEVVS